jgi:hypothetical protein
MHPKESLNAMKMSVSSCTAYCLRGVYNWEDESHLVFT